MKRSEALYIHAVAKLAYDASANGDHPIPREEWPAFFGELMHDRRLSSRHSMELFQDCFDHEVQEGRRRSIRRRVRTPRLREEK